MRKQNPTDVHQRLAEARLAAGFSTASEAARAFGWNENTYRSHENGERGLRIDIARKYAAAFKVDVEYIILGKPGSITFDAKHDRIVGYIDNEGMLVEYPAAGVRGFEELVAMATGLDRDGWMVEIQSNRPIMGCNPGDLIIVLPGEVSDEFRQKLFGNLAIIEDDGGRQFFRRLRFNKNLSEVDLQIYPEMESSFIVPKHIYPVKAIIPKPFWIKMTRIEERRNFEEFMKRLPEIASRAKK